MKDVSASDVSGGYEQTGRSQQKRRTRDQLIDATRTLIAENGAAPTVAEAAAAALISRTTAYRYFPNQTSLLVAAHPETAAVSLLPPGVGDDVEKRLLAAVKAFLDLIIDTETQQRTMLMLSLQPGDSSDLPLRKGRAIAWFEEALAPLRDRFSEAELHRLAVAIRAAVGIEAMVWLTDIAGLSRADAARQMRWSARALLRDQRSAAGAPPSAPYVGLRIPHDPLRRKNRELGKGGPRHHVWSGGSCARSRVSTGFAEAWRLSRQVGTAPDTVLADRGRAPRIIPFPVPAT